MKILIRKTIGSNRETWYMLEGNSKETKPIGEFPVGSGYTVAEGSRFYETDTEITWELKSDCWEAVGQVDITMIEKSITENGVYNPADDEADGYSSVDVDVALNVTTKSITANGTYNAASDEVDGYSSVTVNVASENNAKFAPNPSQFALKNIESIEIPDGVTSISNNAFSGCTGLTSVDIPSSVIYIYDNAFNNCTNLAAITVHKAEGSINGAPWGATNATVVWTG